MSKDNNNMITTKKLGADQLPETILPALPCHSNVVYSLERAPDKQLNLVQLATIRRNNWNFKAAHPKLLHMEMLAHQNACQEYNIDILKHLIELENKTRSSLASFQSQPELTIRMRTLIFDFIMCCHTRLGLSSSTLFLCFNIMDRYCSKIIVKSQTYQLLGLTALWLASKFADKKPRIPSLQNLCCHQYTKQQFKEMELHILKSLNWSVCSAPSHDSFVDILLKTKIAKLDFKHLNLNDLKYGATILCELSCFDQGLNYNYNSSAIALASVTIITCALRLENLKEFHDYRDCTDDNNLTIICNQLMDQLNAEEKMPSSFNLKYSTKNDGALQNNPIMSSLFAYHRHIQEEELRKQQQLLLKDHIQQLHVFQHQDQYPFRSPSTYDSTFVDYASKDDFARRVVSPLESQHPILPRPPSTTIKPFVPPTPTTPSSFSFVSSCNTNLTSAASSVASLSRSSINTPCVIATHPPLQLNQKVKPLLPSQQHHNLQKTGAASNTNNLSNFTTVQNTACIQPLKRNASMMDVDFFDLDQVVVKRFR